MLLEVHAAVLPFAVTWTGDLRKEQLPSISAASGRTTYISVLFDCAEQMHFPFNLNDCCYFHLE